MRDRLIELLIKSDILCDTCGENTRSYCVEAIADYLIENGVIVLPDSEVYILDTAKTIFDSWNDVTGAIPKNSSWYYENESIIEDVVKLSFGAGVLYKEKALKGGVQE